MASDPTNALPAASVAVPQPVSVLPQPVSAPLTRAAIFLILTVNSANEDRAAVLSLCADLSALLRAVGFREPEAALSCIMGFGSDAWDRLFGSTRPAERCVRSSSVAAVRLEDASAIGCKRPRRRDRRQAVGAVVGAIRHDDTRPVAAADERGRSA